MKINPNGVVKFSSRTDITKSIDRFGEGNRNARRIVHIEAHNKWCNWHTKVRLNNLMIDREAREHQREKNLETVSSHRSLIFKTWRLKKT